MATLDSLKSALRQEATATASSPVQPLSDTQYSDGFRILVQGSGRTTYQDFIIPQLSQVLSPLFNSRIHVSVLEIGPGPTSVFGYLPGHLRRKVQRYAAFEPNGLFATRVEEWLCATSETESLLPCLEGRPDIRRTQFVLNSDTGSGIGTCTSDSDEKFDVILFCHSMYGMKPKSRFIEKALEMLVERPEGGMVVVFHRGRTLHGLDFRTTQYNPDPTRTQPGLGWVLGRRLRPSVGSGLQLGNPAWVRGPNLGYKRNIPAKAHNYINYAYFGCNIKYFLYN